MSALEGAVRVGRVSHAYLFGGPAHVGKFFTAVQFAQALNCVAEEPPCGRCAQCRRIAERSHPDVERITIGGVCLPPPGQNHDHSSDNSRDIKICQIRLLEQTVSRAPFEGRWRVLIIEPAEAMNEPAQNALLKTLEEPPPQVVLIVVTEREEMLLETIRSRTRRIAFGRMPQRAIEKHLRERLEVEPEPAANLARLSGGRLGWAVLASQDESIVEAREEALTTAEAMASATLAERFAFAGTLGGGYTKDRAGVQSTLEAWEAWWRDLLVVAAGRTHEVVNLDRLDRLQPLAAQCGVAPAVRALRAIADARCHLTDNASPVLALEVMMLALPQLEPRPVRA